MEKLLLEIDGMIEREIEEKEKAFLNNDRDQIIVAYHTLKNLYKIKGIVLSLS